MIKTSSSTLNATNLSAIENAIDSILGPDIQAREQNQALLKITRDKDFNGYIHSFTSILKTTENLRIKIFCIAHLRRLFSTSLDDEGKGWGDLKAETQNIIKDTTLLMLRDDQNHVYRKILCDLVSDLVCGIESIDLEIYKKVSKEATEWNDLKRALGEMLTSGNAVLVTNALVVVKNIMDSGSEFLSKNILQTFENLKTFISSGMEDEIKQKALLVITDIIKTFPGKFSKHMDSIKDLAEKIFNYMISIDEEPDADWINPPEGAGDDDNRSDLRIAECMMVIDSIVDALSKKSLAIFHQQISEMMKVDDWRYKHSALMGLSQLAEYIKDLQEFDTIVQCIINSLSHEHPKVRYAALHCLGQISADHSFTFQGKYSETILPILVKMLSDNMPRVIQHAMNATINFVEGASRKHILIYLQQILDPTLHFIEKGTTALKQPAINVISALATTCDSAFIPFWEKSCNILFNVIIESPIAILKGQAIETMVKMAYFVGRTEFNKISSRLIEEILKLQLNEIQAEKPGAISHYITSSWSMLCLTMKEDIVPYLGSVLESSLKLAQSVVKAKKENKETLEDEEEVNIVNKLVACGQQDGLSKNKVAAQSKLFSNGDVLLAAKMLSGFFGSGVQPEHLSFVEPALNFVGDFLLDEDDSDDEDIILFKQEAAKSFVTIITALEKSNIAKKKETFLMIHHYWLLRFSKPILEGDDPAILKVYITVLSELIRKAGQCMKNKELEHFTSTQLKVFRLSYERSPPFLRDINEGKEKDEGDEEDQEDEGTDEESNPKKLEEDFRCAIADNFGALFEVYKEKTKPLIKIITKELLPEERGSYIRGPVDKVGLKLISNIIEHFGIDLIPEELPRFTKILTMYANDSNISLRSAAVYGLGVLSTASKEIFRKVAKDCLEALYESLEIRREDNDNIMTQFYMGRDNAVIALGKIIKLQQENIDLQKAVHVWVANLPLWFDTIETRNQHLQLLDMLMGPDIMLVLGEKGENLKGIVELFAKIGAKSKYQVGDLNTKLNQAIGFLSAKEPTKSWLKAAIRNLNSKMRSNLKAVIDKDSEAFHFINDAPRNLKTTI